MGPGGRGVGGDSGSEGEEGGGKPFTVPPCEGILLSVVDGGGCNRKHRMTSNAACSRCIRLRATMKEGSFPSSSTLRYPSVCAVFSWVGKESSIATS